MVDNSLKVGDNSRITYDQTCKLTTQDNMAGLFNEPLLRRQNYDIPWRQVRKGW